MNSTPIMWRQGRSCRRCNELLAREFLLTTVTTMALPIRLGRNSRSPLSNAYGAPSRCTACHCSACFSDVLLRLMMMMMILSRNDAIPLMMADQQAYRTPTSK